jgi:predicted RecB family nuclease
VELGGRRQRSASGLPFDSRAARRVETKIEVEGFVKRYGISKARLIEEALQHHLQALREIPSDFVVPSRLVVTEASMKRVAARLASDDPPTPALRDLMSDAAE